MNINAMFVKNAFKQHRVCTIIDDVIILRKKKNRPKKISNNTNVSYAREDITMLIS